MSTTTDQRHQSAFIFLRRRPEIRRSQSWSGHLWSPGYYMSTSGNMSKETWKQWNEKSSLQSLTGPIQRLVKNSASNLKPGWFAISCKSHPGFCVYMTSFCYGGNTPANPWCDDLADAAFGKITAVYGHSDENGPFVRKWSARKMAITDKMGKNSLLSVRFWWLRSHFYGQTLRKEASVRKSSS